MRQFRLSALVVGFAVSFAAAQEADRTYVLRLQELARTSQWDPVEPACSGQARPTSGRIRQQWAYVSDLPIENLRRLLDSGETEQLGFTPTRRWKWLGPYRARSYEAYPDKNVFFTFSLRPSGKDDTSVCVLLWDSTPKMR